MDDSTDFEHIIKTRKIQAEEWNPQYAALVRAAGSSWDAHVRFSREQTELDVEIWKHERRYKEKGKAIAYKEAVALAVRIKDLILPEGFDGRPDYIAFLAGRCLTLKEGRATGKVYTAFARLEVVNISQWRGAWWTVNLAIPAELRVAGPDAPPLGVQTPDWLCRRCEDVARELARGESPPGSPASRMFDGGGFDSIRESWKLREQPEPDSIPVVLAPHEDTIKEYIQRAESGATHSVDYWDALEKAAAMLLRSQQPLGEALGDWKAREIDGQTKRPKGSKAKQGCREALRNSAIIEALAVLQRCGLPVSRNHYYRESSKLPPAGCDAVAEAFNLGRDIILKIWGKRDSAVS